MSIKKLQYEQLCRKDNWRLQGILSQDIIKIRLLVSTIGKSTKTYQASFNSLKDLGKLEEYCASFVDLLVILKDASNIQVNTEKQLITIIQRSRFNKQKVIELAHINLKAIQTKNKLNQNVMAAIVQKCRQNEQIHPSVLKQIISNLAVCIEQLRQDKRINKSFRQKSQHEIDSLKEQIQQLRKIIQNSNINNLEYQNKIKGNERQNKRKSISPRKNKQKFQKSGQKRHRKNISANNNEVMQMQQIQNQLIKLQCNKIDKIEVGTLLRQQAKKNEGIIQRFQQKLVGFFKQVQARLDKYSFKFQQIQKNLNIEKCKPSLLNAQAWIDSEYSSKVAIVNNVVTAKNPSNIFGKRKKLQVFSFIVSFNKIQEFVNVGIVDIEYKGRGNLIGLPNWVRYSSGGYCYIGGKQMGKSAGYKAGEQIQVIVNLSLGVVEWKIGGHLKYRLQSPIIKDSEIVWVPYIWLNKKDDSLCIIE